jgi:hypothetical protein
MPKPVQIIIRMLTMPLVVIVGTSPAMAADASREVPPVDRATRQAIVDAVCQGKSEKTSIGNGCKVCPTYTSGDGDIPTVGKIHLGSFVNPGSSEAYVSLLGCELKQYNYGGAVLLRKTAKRWRVLRFDPGNQAEDCARFGYKTGTVLLVCSDTYFSQGIVAELMRARYVGPGSTSARTLLVLGANVESCDAEKYRFDVLDRRVGGTW